MERKKFEKKPFVEEPKEPTVSENAEWVLSATMDEFLAREGAMFEVKQDGRVIHVLSGKTRCPSRLPEGVDAVIGGTELAMVYRMAKKGKALPRVALQTMVDLKCAFPGAELMRITDK